MTTVDLIELVDYLNTCQGRPTDPQPLGIYKVYTGQAPEISGYVRHCVGIYFAERGVFQPRYDWPAESCREVEAAIAQKLEVEAGLITSSMVQDAFALATSKGI